MIKQYKISVPKSTLNEIYKKVRNFPWTAAQNMNGWEYGTNLNYLKSISNYWITKYDWKKFENKINSLKNYRTKVEDINLHFIFEKSKNPNSRPLLLLHGWPGSITEFLDIIPRLAHPEKFGGKIGDGFIVLSEILVVLFNNSLNIVEDSTIFVNRKRGESSVNLKLILQSFLGLIKLYFLKNKKHGI